MKELIVTSAIIVKNLVFINPSSTSNSTAQVRQGCMAGSKRLNQLRRNPAHFLQSAEAIFLLENAKLIEFHSAEQSAINGAHDFGGHHRPQSSGGSVLPPEKKTPAPARSNSIRRTKRSLCCRSLQLHFGITEASQSSAADRSGRCVIFADITNDIGHLQSETSLSAYSLQRALRYPKSQCDQTDPRWRPDNNKRGALRR